MRFCSPLGARGISFLFERSAIIVAIVPVALSDFLAFFYVFILVWSRVPYCFLFILLHFYDWLFYILLFIFLLLWSYVFAVMYLCIICVSWYRGCNSLFSFLMCMRVCAHKCECKVLMSILSKKKSHFKIINVRHNSSQRLRQKSWELVCNIF